MQDLIVDHMKLVPFMLSKLYQSDAVRFNRDELLSEGYLALVEASRRYDPERGKFSTLACLMIRQKMLLFLSRKSNRMLASLDAPLPGTSGEDDLTLGDILADKVNVEDDAETALRIHSAELSPTQQSILDLLLDGRAQKEIVTRLRMPAPIVVQNIAVIRAKLIREDFRNVKNNT